MSLIEQMNFSAGEFSRSMMARKDFAKYKNAGLHLRNFIPQTQGPLTKRNGTRFVNPARSFVENTRIETFSFSRAQVYEMEWSDKYCRFYHSGGLIWNQDGTPFELESPYSSDEVNDLQFEQSADVIFITHPNHHPYWLRRFGHTEWELEPVPLTWVPFEDENTTNQTITGTGVVGTVSLSLDEDSGTARFSEDDVGSFIQISMSVSGNYRPWASRESGINYGEYREHNGNLYRALSAGQSRDFAPVHLRGVETDGNIQWEYIHSGKGYAQIVEFLFDLTVRVRVINVLPSSIYGDGTTRWSMSAWSKAKGYPNSVTFFEDRLWFGGTLSLPQTLWASRSGDYLNFKTGTLDDDGLLYTINARERNAIQWLSPGKAMVIGTTGGIFVASGSRPQEAITPSNIRIVRQSTHGSSSIRPIQIGNALIYVQNNRRKIREFTYQFETDAYVSNDLTILNDTVSKTRGGFTDMVYQRSPDSILWFTTEDGSLLGLTYERDHDVLGWHPHVIGGVNAQVQSITVSPHWEKQNDVIWLLVKRTIGGTNVQYVEYIDTEERDDEFFHMDCGLSYKGAPIKVVQNLNHLDGEMVSIVTDGNVHTTQLVKNAEIVLKTRASHVQVGLPYVANFSSMPLFSPFRPSDIDANQITTNMISLGVVNTGTGLYIAQGTNDTRETEDPPDWELVPLVEEMELGQSQPLVTGLTAPTTIESSVSLSRTVSIMHSTPLPCTITGYYMEVSS